MKPDLQFSDQRLADLYDLGNAGSEDREFYLDLAKAAPQTILDLGCGTGLLALAFAKRGHRVVGVDPARAMLNVARRSSFADRVEWIEGTAETYESDQAFDLIIMTGHAFQVLLEDAQVVAALSTMARHLKPDGVAVFESRNPALDWDAVWARAYEMQAPEGPVRAERRMTDRSRAPEYLSFAWDYHFTTGTMTSDSTLRFLSAAEIQGMARTAGLKLVDLFGDWDGSAFQPATSREMIFKFQLDQGA